MSLNTQFILMIHVILYGMFIGITLDCVSLVKRNILNPIVQMTVIVLYWIIQLPLTFIYIYNVNEGIFHLYILIFLFVGVVIYYKLLRQILHKDLEMLGESLFSIAIVLKKTFNILVISPLMFIYKLVSDIIKLLLRILKLIFYTPFANIGKWVFNKKRVGRRGKRTKVNSETE